MKKIPSHSPEYTVSRTYLDWLVELPWNNESLDNNDIENAKKILDTDHYGLSKVKDRILEHLAVRNLKKTRSKKNEILKGIKEGDKIKVWNYVEEEDDDEARRRQDDNSRELED